MAHKYHKEKKINRKFQTGIFFGFGSSAKLDNIFGKIKYGYWQISNFMLFCLKFLSRSIYGAYFSFHGGM